MVAGDDKYTGTVAVSEGSRLIFEQKVKYIFGPIGSSPTVAFSPLMNENKILFFHNSYTPRHWDLNFLTISARFVLLPMRLPPFSGLCKRQKESENRCSFGSKR